MTRSEMRAMAKAASQKKNENEDINVDMYTTVGNAGANHEHAWKPIPQEEKTKEDIERERDEAAKINANDRKNA